MFLRRISTVVAAVILCVRVANCPAQAAVVPENTRQAGTQDAAFRGGLVTPPLPKPEFTLTDTSGAKFNFKSRTDGQVTLLYFGFVHCQSVCPAQMTYLSSAMRSLPQQVRDQVKVVFVTTDPDSDNPRLLRTWLNHFDKSFIGLTGSSAEIQQAESAAKLPRTIKPAEHAAFVVAYTKDNLGHVIYPAGVNQADWLHDLPRLVNATWRDR
jgi:protein SCO1/2